MEGSEGNIDPGLARELAREFAREFAVEFARQLKGSSKDFSLDFVENIEVKKSMEGLRDKDGKVHPLIAHCSEDVLEFYQHIQIVFQFHQLIICQRI